jgi:DNA primase
VRPGRAFSPSRIARGALTLSCGALVLLCGCGGDSKGAKIPSAQANQMTALVRLADQQSAAGTCSGAQDKVRRAQAVLQTVPNNVDKDVRQGIADSLAHLSSLIRSECQRPQKTQTETTQTETSQTQTTQSQTATTPSTTTPTTTTTTPSTTTPTTTTPSTTTPTTTSTGTTTGNGGAGTPSGGGGGGAVAGDGAQG